MQYHQQSKDMDESVFTSSLVFWRLTQSWFSSFRIGYETKSKDVVSYLFSQSTSRKLSKLKKFCNKHLVTLTHPSVFVYYSFRNKTKRFLSLWLPCSPDPGGTYTQQSVERKQLSDDPSIFKEARHGSVSVDILIHTRGIVHTVLMTWTCQIWYFDTLPSLSLHIVLLSLRGSPALSGFG